MKKLRMITTHKVQQTKSFSAKWIWKHKSQFLYLVSFGFFLFTGTAVTSSLISSFLHNFSSVILPFCLIDLTFSHWRCCLYLGPKEGWLQIWLIRIKLLLKCHLRPFEAGALDRQLINLTQWFGIASHPERPWDGKGEPQEKSEPAEWKKNVF